MKYIKNFNNFIFEKKIDVSAYPNSNFLGLVKKSNKRGNTTTKTLTLFDFKQKEVLAHIELDNLNSKTCFDIMRSYAKKDWGAVIYDFALMDTNPLPVVPSKVIMPKAINIWKYYYDLRSDVIKKPILPSDENYSETYKNFLDDTPKSDNNLLYINCYYFMEKSNQFEELLEKGNFLLKRFNLTPSFITNLGYKEFKNVYEY